MKTVNLNWIRLISTVALFSMLVMGQQVNAASQSVERAAKPFDRETALQQRQETHAWLMSEMVDEARNNPIVVHVSDDEKKAIDMARGEVPVRVGLTKPVSNSFSFSDVNLRALKGKALTRDNGALMTTEDGGYVFTSVLSSSGAAAIRVHFTGFRLSEGAEVYLYSVDGQVFGPYTGRGPMGDGEFWSHTLTGDQALVQLRQAGPASDADLANTSFSITGLGHIRPRFMGSSCTYNAECVVNLACATSVSSAVDDAKNAVAEMQWISGAFIYFCTGGLLADTDDATETPYFLTANHCISRGKDARNLETFFKLDDVTRDTVDNGSCASETSMTCDDWADHRADHPQSLRTLGAVIKKTSRTSDYTLLELKQSAPDGTTFLGWDSAAVADDNGINLFRISHPAAAPQSYSEHVVDTSRGTCSSWPRGSWIYSADTFGATEGGSSGSPVVNSVGKVVGQLSGACGTNVSEVCDSVKNATVDGAFSAYYDDIAEFLNPQPSLCTTEVCDGGGGLDPGALCTLNSECASNKCTGKPGSKVCK